ncbi:MAG: hypothetical protein JXA92_11700 [candidate division Zixibacteria bacterium]|nr:hypothetical protein [candidate division Zixibacteria bacterium]
MLYMKSKNIISTLVLIFISVSSLTARADDPVPVITEYFDMLESGNFETAAMMWLPDAQERADRFGIEYRDIPVRVDCASPVVQDLQLFRDYMYQPVKKYELLDHGAFAKLEYSQVVGGESVQHLYYVKKQGDYYWLIYPQDYCAETWPITETKYFRVHYHPDIEKFLNPVLFEAADGFIEEMAKVLNISRDDVKKIAEKKIEFFYCDNDSTVTEITSQKTKGLFDVASNDIISANFPHFHELTHFLVNYKLRNLPLFTLPVVQEGVAVYYGGRWGKKPSALFDLGIFIYREKFVEIDSILTFRGFRNNSGADISYPVAAVFTSYLMDKLGQDNYFKLYLALSGKYRDLAALTPVKIQNKIVEFTGLVDWQTLKTEFENYLDEKIEAVKAAAPGRLDDGKIVLSVDNFKISRNKQWLAFEFPGQGGDTLFQGSLFFGRDKRLEGENSPLFEEQFQGSQPFDGYRYAVRFDRNEAGLYDYGTNELVAKFIWGITPLEGYYDAIANCINIKFRTEALGDKLPDFEDYKFLPL